MKKLAIWALIGLTLTWLTGCARASSEAPEWSSVKPTLLFFYTEF